MTITELNDYQASAVRTASPTLPLIHVALGVTGEAGEFSDAVKKHVIYGKTLDETNLREELGDLLWYIALGCEVLGTTMSHIASENIAKLRARYPDKYTDEHAALRLDKKGV